MNILSRLLCMATVAVVGYTVAADLWAAEEKKPASPREMFRDLGVEDRYFDQLTDGRPLEADEQETVLRVLFRLRVFPPVDLERWALDAEKINATSRGDIFRLRGRVTEVEPIKPTKEAAQRYELPQYYRCRLQLDGSSQTADVYTENVPSEWQKGAKPNAEGGALGAFLKNAEATNGRPLLIFAAPRLAWYPDDLLGRLGLDRGLFDSVQDQKPITAQDREAFYQLLAAVGRAKPDQLLEQAEEDLPKTPEGLRWTDRQGQELYSVVPLFNDAAAQRGRLVELSGMARRVEEIFLDDVQDADIIARFGFNHYFQISLFTEDSGVNPLTFCVRELPEGMPFGNLPRYGEMIRVAGFFFKTWRYPVPKQADSSSPSGESKTAQLSPLLIGQSVSWRPANKSTGSSTTSTVVMGVLFAVVMIIVWIAAWRNRLREKRWEEKLAASEKLDENIDFSHVEQHTEEADPDFNRIAEMDHGKD